MALSFHLQITQTRIAANSDREAMALLSPEASLTPMMNSTKPTAANARERRDAQERIRWSPTEVQLGIRNALSAMTMPATAAAAAKKSIKTMWSGLSSSC